MGVLSDGDDDRKTMKNVTLDVESVNEFVHSAVVHGEGGIHRSTKSSTDCAHTSSFNYDKEFLK